MFDVVASNQFKRDLKLAKKRGYNIETLREVVRKLANGEELEAKYRDHMMTGNYIGFRECHIAPDWVLIYRINENVLELYLSRTGTHSDLLS
ncbi:MAG: type II toxin-antitoxin system YafQ family toxin [Oscillibacter sp.]|nr:type II toxin-antitoxin system YafQ family toxin [Oscillibacter sp.]